MKILKIKKQKSNFKSTCCECDSKLLVDYEDVIVKNGTAIETYSLSFKCPACGAKNYLSYKRECKYFAYKHYKKIKQEDKECKN